MSGVMLSEAAFERVARVVRWVEGDQGELPQASEYRAGDDTTFARLTTGTADGSGHYAAVITIYSAGDAAWTDYGVVKVKPANSEVLTSGTRYPVRPAGPTAAGDELYVALTATSVAAAATDTFMAWTTNTPASPMSSDLAGPAYYSWEEIWRGPFFGDVTWTAKPGGRSGTIVANTAAEEMNGNGKVPLHTPFIAIPITDARASVRFQAPQEGINLTGSGNGRNVHTWTFGGGGVSSSQSDGFGTVSVGDASASVSGVVNLTTQSFAGNKTLIGTLTVLALAQIDGSSSGPILRFNNTFPDPGTMQFQYGGTGLSGGFTQSVLNLSSSSVNTSLYVDGAFMGSAGFGYSSLPGLSAIEAGLQFTGGILTGGSFTGGDVDGGAL